MSFDQQMFNNAVTSNGYPSPSYDVYHEFKKATATFSQREKSMFLAQLIHESGGFQYTEECAYAGKGPHNAYRDCVSLPGKLYHGRGYIQLTWAANYLAASKALGMGDQLLRQPELVSQRTDLSMNVSKWYWTERVRPELQQQPNCFGATTKAINGALECGPTGDNARARRRYNIYENVARAMNVSDWASECGCYN